MTQPDPKAARRALGRGLDALLPSAAPPPGAQERSAFHCPVEKISPQPGQPRQYFDAQELEELTSSIREHGLLEPLVVRRTTPGADKFEHMLAFATLALIARLAWRSVSAWRILERLSFFGALIEVFQSIPSLHRDCDPRDWVADTVAAAVVLAIAAAIQNTKRGEHGNGAGDR